MAIGKKPRDLGAGLFTNISEAPEPDIKENVLESSPIIPETGHSTVSTRETAKKGTRNNKKSKNSKPGRKLAKDLTEKDELVRSSLYLKPEQKIKLNVFAAERSMEQSEAVRYLIDHYIPDASK